MADIDAAPPSATAWGEGLSYEERRIRADERHQTLIEASKLLLALSQERWGRVYPNDILNLMIGLERWP